MPSRSHSKIICFGVPKNLDSALAATTDYAVQKNL
jgi:hypothetical protein